MPGAIRQLLTSIHNQIPEEILELAFDTEGGIKSLDDVILYEIVDGRLLPELSAYSGQYKEIVLDPSWANTSYIDRVAAPYNTVPYVVYEVPPRYREHRKIVRAIGVSFPYGTSTIPSMLGSTGHSVSRFMGISGDSFGRQALNGITGNDNIMLPTPILLDGSRIKLTPMEFGIIQYHPLLLQCRLEYDKEFTNLTPDAVIQLAELAVTACKAYIYNKLIIKLDMGAIHSGQEIGKIKEIIESYSDQNERYLVLREDFHGAAETLDINTMQAKILMGIC